MTKLAIPLTNNTLSEHFGHCDNFVIYTTDEKKVLSTESVTAPPHVPGLYPKWLKSLGVDFIVTGGMGRKALDLFTENGIKVCAGRTGEKPDDIVKAFLDNAIGNETPSCGHDH